MARAKSTQAPDARNSGAKLLESVLEHCGRAPPASGHANPKKSCGAEGLEDAIARGNRNGKPRTGSAAAGLGDGDPELPAVIHASEQRPLTQYDQGPIVLVLAPTRELARIRNEDNFYG